MSKKLNKKLVFVVGSLVLILGVLGMFWFTMIQGNTERHIRAGDEYMAAGDYRKAAETYGRAVSKKATNLDYLAKFKEAVLKIQPETGNEAGERYQQYLATLESEARAARDDRARWRTSLEAFRTQAEAFDAPGSWSLLGDRAETMLRTVPENGDDAAIGRLYRGYAGFRRFDSLNENERADALADLEAALASSALNALERDLALGTLTRAAIRERARADGIGRRDRIEATQAQLDKLLVRLDAELPEGARADMARYELALRGAIGGGSQDALVGIGDRLVRSASALDESMVTLEAAGVLLRGGQPGLEQAIRLLDGYLAKHPDDLLLRRSFAMILRSEDPVRGREELETVLAAPRPTTSLIAALYETNQAEAAVTLFDLCFDATENASEEDRPKRLEAAIAARDQLAKLFAGAGDDSVLLRTDGKILLLKNDPMGAIIKFNEVFRKGSAVNLELYVLAALANMRVQETGRALELVNGGLSQAPGNIALMKLRAQLELMSARTTDAISTLRAVLSAVPDDADAQRLLTAAQNAFERDSATVAASGGTDAFVEFAARVQQLAETKQFDEARRLVREAQQKSTTPDIRLARIAVAVEVQADDLASAKRLTTEALQEFPGDPALARFNAVLASEDYVERIVALAEGLVDDPVERPIAVYMRLMQTSAALRLQAERERQQGLPGAASSVERADRLAQAATEWRAKADAVDPAHPALLEMDFMVALEARNYPAVEAIAKVADEKGRDRSQGPIFRARALILQNKTQEASQILERAIQSGIDASMVYRTLGASLEQMGNIDGALRNYEESYKRRPADMATVRLLVGALVRSGNSARALEVLRQARSLAGFDEEVGNTWLQLEQQFGDRRLAQRMREGRYRVAPTDLLNATALATLLAMAAPDRDDILTEQGRPSYTENQWNSLDMPSRLRELDRVRDSWRKRAETIFSDILARDPKNIDAAASFAGMLRALGRSADGERVLAKAVEAAGDPAGWRGWVTLGQMQCYMNADDRASQSFANAVRLEDPQTKPATRAIAEMLMGIERFALALGFAQQLAAADPSVESKMRVAECLLRLDRPEEARASFDAAVGSGPREPGTEMLDGAISMAIGDKRRMAGDADGAMTAFTAALAPLQRAKQLAPSVPQPFIQDSMLKRKLFELTGERSRGEEALASADRACAIGANFLPAAANRAEILVVLGDMNGAVAELERFVRIAPASVDARRRLVDLFYSSGQFDRAEETIRAAIGYAPGEPAWHYTLGELQVRRGKLAEAAAAYARADELRPDASTLFRQLDAQIRARDFNGAIQACRRRGELLRTNPVARAYLGTALVALGEKGDGVAALRESFKPVKAAFDGGDSKPMEDWYGAVRLLFSPALLDEAEALVKDVTGGDPTVVGWEYLSFLALGNDSAGPQRVIRYLEPLRDSDYSRIPAFGATFLDRLGTSYYLVGRCGDALKAFERALQYMPNNHAILNNYAYLCVECEKDSKRALPAARMAVQLEPTRGEYLDTLALVLVAEQQWREALDYADRAAKLSNSAAVQLHRAMALKGLDQSASALEALAQAKGLNPDPPTLKSIQELEATLK
ncbi:MAG: tetratricopeptide repeat protein [Phycisphaerales bacterium]